MQEEVIKAVQDGDGKRLLVLGQEDPVQTLAFLDGCMRGMIYGPPASDWLAWLESLDKFLRRWLRLRSVGEPAAVSERDVDAAIMRGAYSHGDLFLVAGAGISKGGGISEWKDLVLKVLRFALEQGSPEQRKRVAQQMRQGLGFAPAWAEEQIEQTLATLIPLNPEDRENLEETSRKLSAQNSYDSAQLLQATAAAKKALGAGYFDLLQGILYFSHQIHQSKAHQAIARMVRPKEHPMTPRVFSIVTYNFDDLIESAVWNVGYGCKAHCSKGGQWISQERHQQDHPLAVDVYHVHGYVPSQMRFPKDIDLVFSAEEYEVAYGKNNSITRAVQASHFGAALGLIVGSSLIDEYTVRQLRQIHAQRPGWYNYVLMSLPDDRTREHYRELGLRVMWFEPSPDFREIPELLEQIVDGLA